MAAKDCSRTSDSHQRLQSLSEGQKVEFVVKQGANARPESRSSDRQSNRQERVRPLRALFPAPSAPRIARAGRLRDADPGQKPGAPSPG